MSTPRCRSARAALTALGVASLLLVTGCGRSGPEVESSLGGDSVDSSDSQSQADGGSEGSVGQAMGATDGAESAMAGVRVVSDQPVITVPEGATLQTTTTATTFPVPASQVYVVQSGDTLSGIASGFGVTIDQLRLANPNIEDINRIKQGQELIIPTPG